MNRKTTFLFSFNCLLFFLILVILPFNSVLKAQSISPQKLPFSAICAGGPHPTIPNGVFNEYQAKIKVTGFANTESFFVELSDSFGSFIKPTATIKLANFPNTDPDTETDKTLTFAIPTDLVGSDDYQLRVKSSTGIISPSFTIFGSVSDKYFPAYFKAYNESFYIADKKEAISFCTGNSVVLTVYNPTPSDLNSSPLNFPQLKYNWYKDDVLISGQTGYQLVVNTGGVYYAELNYGPCTDSNFRSQAVTVTSSAGGGIGASIVSSLGNPFCSSSEKTTLTATAGNSYVWKKDGSIIVGAKEQTYKTDLPGKYTCDIDFGGCSVTAIIDLKNGGIITVDGSPVPDNGISIAEGNNVSVTAATNSSNPTFQWFQNNLPIDGATQNVFNVNVAGNYKVSISGCTISFKVYYDTKVPKVPNIISPNGDGVNDTWIIPDEYNNKNTHVTVLSSLGEIVFETDNYENYNAWPQSTIEFKNFNPVFYYIITPNGGSAQKGSITLLK